MPDIRDFLPPPPWEGPPLPRSLVEYAPEARPYELELTEVGVLYLHSLLIGTTKLRICRIPTDIALQIPKYHAVLDLKAVIPRPFGVRTPKWKKFPTFILILPEKVTRAIVIVDKDLDSILGIINPPKYILESLEMEEFTDITVGVTKLKEEYDAGS